MIKEIDTLFNSALHASRDLLQLSEKQINQVLEAVADEAVAQAAYIVEQNRLDLDRMEKTDPKYDRLLLNKERIMAIASDLRKVASLPSPLNRTLDKRTLPNGLELKKKTTPFGVIGIIYEARPNVSFDVFSLCLKAGSVALLKGGSDAHFSNLAIVGLIHDVLISHRINPNVCILLPDGREATAKLLEAEKYVDLIIPRGGQGLIRFVRENAKVPVIETGAGICHTYFHDEGNLQKGKAIITNAKTRKVSVCNALDCLLIAKSRLLDLPLLCEELASFNVEIFADRDAFSALENHYPNHLLKRATADSFGTEFLSYKMAIKSVDAIEDALGHIATYSSKHSEAIVSESAEAIELFTHCVDAACVYSNASTAFTDGAQFGMGAEIGISTQKMHARGPMALDEICSYKWIITGNGQTRS